LEVCLSISDTAGGCLTIVIHNDGTRAGAEIKLEQCTSSDEVQKLQLGGRVAGSSRSALSWFRDHLGAGTSPGGWLANRRIQPARRS
jgi:hypothetical protein